MHQSEVISCRRSGVDLVGAFGNDISDVASVGVPMNYNSQLIAIDCERESGQCSRRATSILIQGWTRFFFFFFFIFLECKEGASRKFD